MGKNPHHPAHLVVLAGLFLVSMLAGCGAESPAAGTGKASDNGSEKKKICRRAQSPVTVDGFLDEWREADSLRLDDPSDRPDPNQAKIYTLWDENYLYVGFEVRDRFLVGFQTERDHRELFKDDMIEVLIDPRRDATDLWLEDDLVYHVNVLGQVKDDRGTPEGISDATWQSDGLWAVNAVGTLNDSTDLDWGFSVELAVPWREIGLKPAPGVSLGINFAIGDNDGAGEHLWDWCGARPFRQPSAFGVLTLE